MNIAIVGGRDFSDYTLLKESLLAYIDTHETPENIVSGGAKGADTLAAQFATEMDFLSWFSSLITKNTDAGQPWYAIPKSLKMPMWSLPFGTDNQKVPKIALLKRKNYKKNCILYPTEKKQKRIKKARQKKVNIKNNFVSLSVTPLAFGRASS